MLERVDIEALTTLVKTLETGVKAVAQNGSYPEYEADREALLEEILVRDVIPPMLQGCRNHDLLWGYMTSIAYGGGAWAARRQAIAEEFGPLYERITSVKRGLPIAEHSETFKTLPDVQFHMEKAYQLIHSDPESAPTKARNVLEGVCKHILNARGETFEATIDLGPLVKKTAKLLDLQLTAPAFSGITTLTNIIGEVRNKYGDAHGGGAVPPRRLAQFAVHIAGSTAVFFLESHQESP